MAFTGKSPQTYIFPPPKKRVDYCCAVYHILYAGSCQDKKMQAIAVRFPYLYPFTGVTHLCRSSGSNWCKNMKMNALIIAGLLALVCMVMIAPVMADTVSITGNPGTAASISLNQTSISMPLAAGSTATNTSLGVTVSANNAFSVAVADTGGNTHAGYMSNASSAGAYQSAPSDTHLAAAFQIQSDDNTTYSVTGHALQNVAGSSPVYTHSAGGTGVPVLLTNTLSQAVAYSDPVLPGGYNYQIKLDFTVTPS